MDTDDKQTVSEQSTDISQGPDKSQTDSLVTSDQTDTKVVTSSATERSGFKARLLGWKNGYLRHKKVTIPLTVVVLLLVLLGIPATRWPILGVVIKKDYTVTILDSKTDKPISSVDVSLDGKTAKTDQSGKAIIARVSVGNHKLVATKKYYQDANNTVLVSLKGGESTVKLSATGRQVAVKVTNGIDGSAVNGAQVTAAGTEVKTDEKGEAVIVLPADKDSLEAKISGSGYNEKTAQITVVESDQVADNNKFTLTPSGKIYFLSKRTGKINVMKSNLDGTNPEVVLAATGNEDDGDTILLASQDWKYLALKAKRDAGKPASLYLIDTANGDKLTNIDEGDASFTLTGWSGHTFVYLVQRDKVQLWQPKKYSIKSFDADGKKLNVLDNTNGEGTGAGSYYGTDWNSEYYTNLILVGDTVHYGKTWTSGIYASDGSRLAGKQTGIYSVKANGQDKKTLKSFDATKYSSMESKLYKPREVYYRIYTNNSGNSEFYEVENDAVQTKGDLSNQFYAFYPTYLYDPSNQHTFWAEPRDGKNTLFIGDNDGSNSKEITTLSEYAAYGWFTDKYVLVSKNSSELYIMGAGELRDGAQPVKITDYHKPNTTFYGYGGGYGGL